MGSQARGKRLPFRNSSGRGIVRARTQEGGVGGERDE